MRTAGSVAASIHYLHRLLIDLQERRDLGDRHELIVGHRVNLTEPHDV
jgi:hypothetical protein